VFLPAVVGVAGEEKSNALAPGFVAVGRRIYQ
jgi:hypothetical protein